ncbi:hypothetical protein I350_06866 [Cryptococcus amylolentus CBS 6273]|uniref:HTH CENPB-type domain-containing protein n=1 Tax=Cryptococcus amylolentus CBS 6273 TaxID=1296118 RepID=A0A1E3JJD5_9TREE|nr:hypothetical protein I350_06866 [Cryptococcus amylolentus CBS 6273]
MVNNDVIEIQPLAESPSPLGRVQQRKGYPTSNRVLEALRAANRQEKPNLAVLSCQYDVPIKRLRNRYKGIPTKHDSKHVNKPLADTEEKILLEWIRLLDGWGTPPTKVLVKFSANQILAWAWDGDAEDAPTVGSNWVDHFLQRTESLHHVEQKSVELARVAALEPKAIAKYFREFEEVRGRYGIQPSDIWNMDEVGFRIGVGGNERVYTTGPKKAAYAPTTTNRQFLTIIEAISAAGKTIPPQVILPGKKIMAAWTENDLPNDTLISCSETGYTNSNLALAWIEHFAKHTEMKTYSLDLHVFQPYKHWHRKVISEAARLGCINFDKTEFMAALHGFQTKAFKSGTIKHAFKMAGLVPYDPCAVLKRLEGYKSRDELLSSDEEDDQSRSSTPSHDTPSAPIPSSPGFIFPTLKTDQELKRMWQKIVPTKGTFIQSQLGMMARNTLDEKTAAAEAREKRKANKCSLVSSYLDSGSCCSQGWAKKQEFEAKQRKGRHLSNKREVYLRKEDGGWRQVLQVIKDIGGWGGKCLGKADGPI